MSHLQAEIPPFDYKGGRAITEKLNSITGCKSFNQLADVLGIPKSTIATWHQREVTPFEIAVRLHLAKGVSIKWLLLDEGEPFPSANETEPTKPLNIQRLMNGSLEDAGEIVIDVVTLNKYHLQLSTTKIIDEDGKLFFINTEQKHATSGHYLIGIDGSLSINPVQRLPGKKLAVGFSGSTIDISEDDIEVLGRVAMEMKKK